MNERMNDEQLKAFEEHWDDYGWVDADGHTWHISEVVDEAIVRGRERDEALRQLEAVDQTLSGRPALDEVQGRCAKIERACSAAGRGEDAKREKEHVLFWRKQEKDKADEALAAALARAEKAEQALERDNVDAEHAFEMVDVLEEQLATAKEGLERMKALERLCCSRCREFLERNREKRF